MKEYHCLKCNKVMFKGEGLDSPKAGSSSNFNFYSYFYLACSKCSTGNYFGLRSKGVIMEFAE